jgi:hypothetical protein
VNQSTVPEYVGRNAPSGARNGDSRSSARVVAVQLVTKWYRTSACPNRRQSNSAAAKATTPPSTTSARRRGVRKSPATGITPPAARALVRARLDLVPTTTRHRRPTSESETPIFKVVA